MNEPARRFDEARAGSGADSGVTVMFLCRTAVLAFAATIFCPFAAVSETPSAMPENPIEAVYYRYAVVEYCSLSSEAVLHGFEAERDRLVAEAGADEEEHRKHRLAGWTAADLEWSNRGLGGFRNWCRTEGAAAAEGFIDAAP
jgi:hypothetical protein